MAASPAARLLLLACMVWGLVLAPFAHALGMAATLAASQQEAASHCHQPDGDKLPSTDCCCHKGQVCHCAVPAALPCQLPLALSPVPVTYSVSVESFPLHNLPPPEPPPPRLG
jgi:hypothetical protein